MSLKYKDNFVLKDGLLLFSMSGFMVRPTRDIGFLAYQISNDMENIKEVFGKICKVGYNDGMEYQVKNFTDFSDKEIANLHEIRISEDIFSVRGRE